jgi:hypothetical protein
MKTTALQLTQAAPPWLHTLRASPAAAYEAGWRLADQGSTVRVVRGHKMHTARLLFDEFGAALQFPDYFGENWPALDECLSDLSWMPADRYVILITRAHEVLLHEGREVLSLLRDVLTRAAEAWAQPVERGEAWDRPAVPFHVILQVTPGNEEVLNEVWGASMPDLEL